jgi:putative phosphoribosyl transferase
MRFKDRAEAGRLLGERLSGLEQAHPVVLGLPRGGVAVAAEVASALDAPLDVVVVRKLGVPFQPELAMGALGEGGVRVINEEIVRAAGVTRPELAAVERRERAELERRAARYRAARPPVPLAGRLALLVDDGVATGATAKAACLVARSAGAARVVAAAPVVAAGAIEELAPVADEVVFLDSPERFGAIGSCYDDFAQLRDEDVLALLEPARPPSGPPQDRR